MQVGQVRIANIRNAMCMCIYCESLQRSRSRCSALANDIEALTVGDLLTGRISRHISTLPSDELSDEQHAQDERAMDATLFASNAYLMPS